MFGGVSTRKKVDVFFIRGIAFISVANADSFKE